MEKIIASSGTTITFCLPVYFGLVARRIAFSVWFSCLDTLWASEKVCMCVCECVFVCVCDLCVCDLCVCVWRGEVGIVHTRCIFVLYYCMNSRLNVPKQIRRNMVGTCNFFNSPKLAVRGCKRSWLSYVIQRRTGRD